ncbi:MAG TPA: 2OG-Fe(II) oxygenase [Rhodopila sp.]|uniref:2OG-Fe(II) oxygenase family protein n=1 Tax=Rhodopila sp. TaxID=2480087 RepID=UPI002B82268B|nr:2OG-Fe(II) oxygenase [Rhodopila sp.]HVY17205.1 2OG-Fe(II) oxygenase [Rhodopila sp.]
MRLLDLQALADAPLTRDPFMFTVVRDFIRPEARAALQRDFPHIPYPGLLPVEATQGGPSFTALIEDVRGPAVAQAFSAKLGLDLATRPMMVTVRGQCDIGDGRIHTDSETKLVTALLYLNDGWNEDGGRLRLLRGPDDLDDMIAEVPPDFGTLIAFRRSDRSFHGHEPYVGPRRYVMFNWMASGFSAWREISRHRLSAMVKRQFGRTAREEAVDA